MPVFPLFRQGLWALLLTPCLLLAQIPVIDSLTPRAPVVAPYAKFELQVALSASYADPYDYSQITVAATFLSPAGDSFEVEGFFAAGFDGPLASGALIANGEDGFLVRFAPPTPGTWTYRVQVTDTLGSSSSAWQSFLCVREASPPPPGRVRLSGGPYLQFEDGSQFVPIGQNLGWPSQQPYLDYRRWIDSLRQAGANFFRMWNCDWGLGLEWLGGAYEGLGQYQQTHAAYLDWLFDYAGQHGVYVMLCLQHHGQVSTQVNPQWAGSPYNAANGGMCPQPHDFFSHPQARARTRNRLRYTVARYGYAHSLMAWELFNEVDWTDDYLQHQGSVADWHEEMAGYLKQIDPYGRLVTTSFARDAYGPLVWTLPEIDFTQTHYYAAVPNLERVLAQGIRNYLSQYDKPTLTGEFGIRTSGGSLNSEDPSGIHLHNSLWGSFFAGGMGSGLSWWWDTYLEPQNQYPHYGPLVLLTRQLPLLEREMTAGAGKISGVAGSLLLTPNQGWGQATDDSVRLQPDGSTLPAHPRLGEYLYGAQWNTQYRNPPRFLVDFPQAGPFELRTGAQVSNSARIQIRIDGQVALDQLGQPGQVYSVPVPAGPHVIEVDNPGTDWITVAGYAFAGLGQALDVYLLQAADGRLSSGWLLNHAYNHVQLKEEGPPPQVEGASLTLSGVPAGTYYVNWFDCLSGTWRAPEAVIAAHDSLVVSVPAVAWDLAFLIDEQPLTRLPAQATALNFSLFPNPLPPSQPLSLTLDLPQTGALTLRLLDGQGRQLATQQTASLAAGPQQLAWSLPPELAAGWYVVQVAGKGVAGAKLLWIGP